MPQDNSYESLVKCRPYCQATYMKFEFYLCRLVSGELRLFEEVKQPDSKCWTYVSKVSRVHLPSVQPPDMNVEHTQFRISGATPH